MKKSFFILLFCLSSFSIWAQQTKRTDWFEEARYGLFIHWGLYSAAEGLWKGEKLRYVNNYAEWIRYRNRISKDEYGDLAKRFDWDTINPEEWVLLAKKAGMKYIIITTKHHDGVAIWDTKIGNYSLPQLANTNRDVIKEMAEACRKHGMKLGFYYSHWIDWEHPFAWDHNQELTGHVTDEQFDQYWQNKAIPQLRELLTQYGDIAMMWFDMWIPYEKTIFKKEQLEQAVALIRELQPNCLINSRLGLPADAKYVDFETLGDNQFGSGYKEHPWETPGTIAHSWGYSGYEKEWKSTGQLFESLISNVALNGGFTLNIGPRADGTVPYESITRLKELGAWLDKYGEAVYANTGIKLPVNQHDWGKITRKKDENKLYLHVFNWPLDQLLRVTGIQSKPSKIELLYGDHTEQLTFLQNGPLLHINLPKQQSDPYVSVIRVSYESLDLAPNIVAESSFGGFSLQPYNAINRDELQLVSYDGTRPTHIRSQGNKITWEVYLPAAGKYNLDLSAHNPNEESVSVTLNVAEQKLAYSIDASGKVVAEPNENNYTDEFVDNRIGSFHVDKPGIYTLKLETGINQSLWINRLWISTLE